MRKCDPSILAGLPSVLYPRNFVGRDGTLIDRFLCCEQHSYGVARPLNRSIATSSVQGLDTLAWNTCFGLRSRLLIRELVASHERVCSRRQKKYENPHSTLVIVDGANAFGPSPIERCAMSAETRLMAKPA